MRLFQADQLRGDGCLHGEARPSGPGAICGTRRHYRTRWRLADPVRLSDSPRALGCAIYVLIAALIAHHNFGDPNQMSHIWKNMAIVGGFIALMVAGPGSCSVDGRTGVD